MGRRHSTRQSGILGDRQYRIMTSQYLIKMWLHANNCYMACWSQYIMGCSCPYCPHEYVTECESAYCNCCSISQHKLGSLIKNEKELSALLETKYNFE